MVRYDVLGQELRLGDRVACAFSYSQASVGYMRLGRIEEMEDDHVRIRWEESLKLSPKMNWGSSNRWMRL